MTTEELIAARRAEPWREALRKSKKNKERTDIPRVEMNELDPEYRSHTRLEEVNLGLTKEQAMQEAQRCLDCPNPTCMEGLPGEHQHPDIYQEHRTRRVPRSSQSAEGNQRVACRLRPCLSAGETMRKQMHPSEDEKGTGSYRLPRTFRSRLRA